MKNKALFQVIGGAFAVAVGVSQASAVSGAPVAGVFDELGNLQEEPVVTASAEEAPEEGTPVEEAVSDVVTILPEVLTGAGEATSPAPGTIEEINTELSTELKAEPETEVEVERFEDNAQAGVSLMVADMITGETEGTEALVVTPVAVTAEEVVVQEVEDGEAQEAAPAEEVPAEAEEEVPAAETEAAVEAAPEEVTPVETAPEAEEAGEVSVATDAAVEAEAAPEEETVPADDSADHSNIGIATVTDYVNVRAKADQESEAVGKLYANNACEILKTVKDGTWYKIRSGELEGFVSAEYVTVGDEDLIKQAAKRLATVNTETLFVRALPSQNTDVVGMVPDQEVLTVFDEQFVDNWGWVGVNIAEGTGYVSTEFVNLSTEYTYGETKEAEEARLAKEEEERKAAEAAAAASSSGSSSSGGVKSPGSSTGSSVADFALQFVGNPYVYGGTSLTNGADCSGFVMSVYAQYGIGLPHSSSALRGVGYGVDPGSMSPGDIVCYSGHVGIYIGGGQIVHASTAATGIKVSSAYYRDILAVRRIF